MSLRLKNSFGNAKEEFKPIVPGKVRIYTCGPTVYNFQHIGNFRTFSWGDLLRRYLLYKGYDVTYVMNVTDIDDKIIRDSQAQGKTRGAFIRDYAEAFFADMDGLGIMRPDIQPYATDHIDEMVDLVQKLVAAGLAYEVSGSYYYRINAFEPYGGLANLDMGGLRAGARVASDEYEKDSVSDFALWKAWVPSDGDNYWETPIGKGRPGWHLECSAMSMKYLGETFDIHTGGVDLKFPHHENEIAQSEGATGRKFVNYWLHGEHLIVEGKKMSKSLGNFYTLRDIFEKGYSGVVVRHLLISTHYRQQLNFTFAGLESSAKAVERYTDFVSNLEDFPGSAAGGQAGEIIARAQSEFESNLDDDLNVSGALAAVFDFIRDINRLRAEGCLTTTERDQAMAAIRRIDSVLNFTYHLAAGAENDAEIAALVEERAAAKKNRDFAAADRIRDQLIGMGILLEDTPQGTKWKRKV